jgi:hypothetical protein
MKHADACAPPKPTRNTQLEVNRLMLGKPPSHQTAVDSIPMARVALKQTE